MENLIHIESYTFIYTSLFFSSFLAATVVPFSSEAILVSAIFLGGKPVLSITIATVGNWIGGMTSYYLGFLAKWEWLGKYFRISQDAIIKLQNRLEKHSSYLAFFCWLPFVGDILAVALGYFRISFIPVLIYMFLGKLVRYIVWYFLFFEAF